MKKILFTIIAISFVSLSSLSQYFEGKVTYKVKNFNQNSLSAEKLIYYFDKRGNSKREMFRTQENSSPFIVSMHKQDSSYACDHEQKTVYIQTKTTSFEKKFEEETSEIETNEESIVLGVKCIKSLIKKNGQIIYEVWYSKDHLIAEYKEGKIIKSKLSLKSINYDMEGNKISRMEATKIEDLGEVDLKFNYPEDYTVYVDYRLIKKKKPKKKKKKRKLEAIDNNQKI